jgi:hypothetical protein
MLPQVAFAMPTIATLVVGVALVWARRERLAPRAWRLAVAGLAVLLTGALADMLYLGLLPQLLRRGPWQDMNLLIAGMSLLFLVLHVLGVALLIAAILASAPPKDPWGAPPPPGLEPPQAGAEPPTGVPEVRWRAPGAEVG